MNRRHIFTFSAMTALGLAFSLGTAIAQTKSLKDQLVGMWTLVSETDITSDGKRSEGFGPNPLGAYIFDAGGHFAQMLMRSDLPKFDNRLQGTPDQNKAVAQGSVAYYGPIRSMKQPRRSMFTSWAVHSPSLTAPMESGSLRASPRMN